MGADGGYLSDRFAEASQAPCTFRHSPANCKCDRQIYHMGQDECIYKSYLTSGKEWVTQGVRTLRKKTDGPGEMISAVQDEIRGFGFPVTEDELKFFNARRKTQGRPVLDSSPGTCFLTYGKEKEGWWDYDKFEKQVIDLLDFFEFLYPMRQLLLEVDWSSGHAKFKSDGLHINNMNIGFGGKQKSCRSSILTSGSLGLEDASMTWKGQVIDLKLKVGQTQSMIFLPGSPPPFYDLNAPEYDVTVMKKKTKKKPKKTSDLNSTKEPVKKTKRKSRPAIPKPVATPTTLLLNSEDEEEKLVQGYIGKAKGKRQILWERGLWKPGMTGDHKQESLNIDFVLGSCEDFKEEKGALQEIVESRGHILLMSPKCHPEIAGVGIEYAWGISKLNFRWHINDEVPAHLHANICRSLSPEIVSIGRVRNYARRTRDYGHVYLAQSDQLENGFEGIEKMRKQHKCHRSVFDMDMKYILKS
eukprot:Pompholyxophrys_punicea_v1_NODE_122_length_3354_cov_5.345862.p1 type:complete len:471 gc:universal NODE_122_length_3354_cov_5.345862:1263-2675(+)